MNTYENIVVSNTITEVLSAGAISGPAQGTVGPSFSFTNGTSSTGTVANVIDLRIELTATLASSGSTTYTLSSMTDALGRTVAFARVHKINLWLTSVTDGDYLSVGQAGSNPFPVGSTQAIPVYGALLLVAPNKVGHVVASGSADQLKIHNSGSNSITYTIAITGCST